MRCIRLLLFEEYLVLHTRQSLNLLLKASTYINFQITGYQRYPLANHLYWLSQKSPGGHSSWDFLSSFSLDESYSDTLSSLDLTDTLIAIVQV